jgi:hypothetical protein
MSRPRTRTGQRCLIAAKKTLWDRFRSSVVELSLQTPFPKNRFKSRLLLLLQPLLTREDLALTNRALNLSLRHSTTYVRKTINRKTNNQSISFFLKSAWPETKRCKEPEVIIEAYQRAKELLGTEAQSVTDHLPVLISSQELAYTSTEIIRRLVKSTTTDGFRVQLWMLSKKLQPIHTLDPKDFWRAFWHTIRCKFFPSLRWLSIYKTLQATPFSGVLASRTAMLVSII